MRFCVPQKTVAGLVFRWILSAVIIAGFASPAMARNEKVNFSDLPGLEHADDSLKLDVPYVPTPISVVRTLLKLGSVGPDDFLIDLGSGDGRMVITAAKELGARGFGVDLNEKLVKLSEKYAVEEEVADRTRFLVQDIFKTDLHEASVVTMYLLNEVNLKLRPKLLKELKVGTRIISHDFHMGEWRPDKILLLSEKKFYQDDTLLYLWVVPAQVAGNWHWTFSLLGETHSVTMELNQSFQNISGVTQNGYYRFVIFDQALEGDRIRFSLVSEAGDRMIHQNYSGRIQGNSIVGLVKLGGTVTETVMEWKAQRVK
ncbi:MAG: class I SAM-dependent methyltransferase [Desulfobacterales bacterium]|nr:class I SAM-dependent methyltransferase [Desulfobacterales bacterium]